MTQVGLSRTPDQRAVDLGVVDAFVFRRLSATRWAHLGGLGRGRGWAGLVDVEEASEPLLSCFPVATGGVTHFDHTQPQRMLGPYYAVGGALVRVSNDVVVLLGNPTEALAHRLSDVALREFARSLDADLEEIAPSKCLGDELEILHAVRAATTGPASDLTGTLRHLLDVALEALSCEVGIIRDGAGHLVTASSWPRVAAADPRLCDVLAALEGQVVDELCLQDTESGKVTAPLDARHGVRSMLVLSIPEPVGGFLLVAHTDAGPRGFTSLCRRLGRQLADAVGIVAHTAALREGLAAALQEQATTARRDPLTGLGNRLTWDEALTEAQDDVDAGGCATLVSVDLDGLKVLNDSLGHDVGDELLKRCAEILRAHRRSSDVCVRLGGDEFAMLLPVEGKLARDRVASLREALRGRTSCEDVVAASVGAATVGAGGSVADAFREADASMYTQKRARRSGTAQVLASNSPTNSPAP